MKKNFLLSMLILKILVIGLMLTGCTNSTQAIKPVSVSELNENNLLFKHKEAIQEIKIPIKLNVPAVDWILLSEIKLLPFSFYGTLEDFAKLLEMLLEKQNVPISVVIIENKYNRKDMKNTKQIDQTQIQNKTKINIPHFEGTLADLVYLLQKTYGIVAETKKNKLFLYSTYNFKAQIPIFSEEEYKKLEEKFGKDSDFQNIFYIPESGTLIWYGNYFSLQKIEEWLKSSEAMLTKILYNVMIYESVFKKDKEIGLGIIGLENFSSDVTLSISSPDLLLEPAQKIGINLDTFNIWFKSMIEKGDIRIVQKLLVATKSGKEVILEVGEKVPYVSEVSSVIEEGEVTSDVKINFGEALSGVNIKLKPYYDIQVGHVLTEIEISVEDVRRMVNVRVGDKEYERPETSIRKINSTVAMHPGQVYIFGGFALKRSEKTRFFGLTPLFFKNMNANKRLFFAIHVQIVKIKPVIMNIITY